MTEFAQVISILMGSKEFEKPFSDSCVTVYNNYCNSNSNSNSNNSNNNSNSNDNDNDDDDNLLDYHLWLSSMGFERNDDDLFLTLLSSLSGLFETDNRR